MRRVDEGVGWRDQPRGDQCAAGHDQEPVGFGVLADVGVDAQPGAAYLTVSYNHKLTIRDNRRVRMVVESNWYQSAYAVHFVSDQNEKSRVETRARGWRIASSVGGSATGANGELVISKKLLGQELTHRSQGTRFLARVFARCYGTPCSDCGARRATRGQAP